jgi:hypothetical protein
LDGSETQRHCVLEIEARHPRHSADVGQRPAEESQGPRAKAPTPPTNSSFTQISEQGSGEAGSRSCSTLVIALFLVSAEQRRSHVSSFGSLWAPRTSATVHDRCAGLDFTRCVNQFLDVRIGKRSGVCAAAYRMLGPVWASASLGKDKSRSTKSSKPVPVELALNLKESP